MAARPPDSPTKDKLRKAVADKLPLERKKREEIAKGGQSIILADGHTTVLLVTRTVVAKRVEILREALANDTQDTSLIEIPTMVGVDVDLMSLMDPDLPELKHAAKKKELNVQFPEIWKKNIVYQLQRHEGNVENLENVRFKEDTIERLEKTLYDSIAILHRNNITHGDICAKNILYSGTYPNFTFRLCDFGSCDVSDPVKDAKKYAADLQKIQRVVQKAKDILTKIRKKHEQDSLDGKSRPISRSRRTKHLIPSPKKSVQKVTNKTYRPIQDKPTLANVKKSLKAKLDAVATVLSPIKTEPVKQSFTPRFKDIQSLSNVEQLGRPMKENLVAKSRPLRDKRRLG